MSTGIADGAYHHFGQRYREILQANGIELELRPSSGGIENLPRLNDGSVSVAFVQGGTGLLAVDADALVEATPLRSLATVAYEPVWIFTHTLDLSKASLCWPDGASPWVSREAATTRSPRSFSPPTASRPTAGRPHPQRW